MGGMQQQHGARDLTIHEPAQDAKGKKINADLPPEISA